MSQKITQKTILSLQPPANGNRIQYDAEIPGFGVRITSNGAISFVLNYRLQGRERRYTSGVIPNSLPSLRVSAPPLWSGSHTGQALQKSPSGSNSDGGPRLFINSE